MSVVGIDFGNQNCVISVARKGIVEIIANEVSNRRTPALVAFDGHERQLGEAAAVRSISNATNTISDIKRLLGRRFNDPDFQADREKFYFQTILKDQDSIAIEVNYMDEVVEFTPEQIAAALFGCLKRITEAALSPHIVQDCVITIPAYFTDVQRRSILDAAGLVGFNVLRLLHETTAVALQYGILRTLPQASPIKVMFVDIGHSATTVTVASMVQGKLVVLGTASDQNLGGRDFDQILIRKFVGEIQAQHKIDVSENPKAMLRLAQVAERTKKMLSANYEAPWNVECLINELDVRGMVHRTELESICISLLERILIPIKTLMHEIDLKAADLHSVEIVGGTIRIPAVRATLDGWFGRPCSTTCDGDEAVARGASLMCAMLSPSFRVRDFDVQDVIPSGIEVAYGPESGSMGDFTPLFPKYNPIPVTKMINFYRPEPFQIEARYSDPVPGVDSFIGRFHIAGIPQQTDPNKPVKSKVKVRLDLNGIISVPSAHSVQEEAVSEPTPAPAATFPLDEPKAVSDAGGQSDAPPMEEESVDTSQPAPAAAATTDEQKMDVDTAPKKKSIKRTDLQVVSNLKYSLPADVFQNFHEREVQMHNEDKMISETLEKRNDLEAYIYEMRDRVSMDLSEYFNERTRDTFLTSLDKAEAWLYSEESEDAQKSAFVGQLASLMAMGDPPVKRYVEFEQRDRSVLNATNLLNMYQEFASSQDEKFAHISDEKRNGVTSKCTELASWLSEVQAKQKLLSKCDDPAFTAADIGTKCKELSGFVEPIMRTPKPAPKPKPVEPTAPSDDDSTAMRDENSIPVVPDNGVPPTKDGEATAAANSEPMNVD